MTAAASGGITCPSCGLRDTSEVKDSRPTTNGQRRRRLCPCGHRFTTAEVVVPPMGTVVRIADRDCGLGRHGVVIDLQLDDGEDGKRALAARIARAVDQVLGL